MAIIIQNVSQHVSMCGWHDYEIRINDVVKASFRHKREEGLTVCLRKAMEAVERAKWESVIGDPAWEGREITS